MLNQHDYQPGDLVRIRDRRPDDVMAWYVFRGWSDARPHPRAGRIARLAWSYNGTDGSSWEADMAPDATDPETVRATITAAHALNPCNRATAVVA
jgi:hypothetical protein